MSRSVTSNGCKGMPDFASNALQRNLCFCCLLCLFTSAGAALSEFRPCCRAARIGHSFHVVFLSMGLVSSPKKGFHDKHFREVFVSQVRCQEKVPKSMIVGRNLLRKHVEPQGLVVLVAFALKTKFATLQARVMPRFEGCICSKQM